MTTLQHRPILLMILDGWGYTPETAGNAIATAKTPNFDHLWQRCPHALLSASGLDVGLPIGQMGNSEVGHLHIGAGRQVLQDLAKLDQEAETGNFAKNKILKSALEQAKETGKAVHILGLLSNGGIHSRNTHIEALIACAAQYGLTKVYLHAFLDGRDTPPQSALEPIKSMEHKMQQCHCGQFASLGGRYFGMDRDKRWERVERAYDLLTAGTTEFHYADPKVALDAAYARGETDEFVQPTAIHSEGGAPITIQDGDIVIFMNFRADRAREISYALTDVNFSGFQRKQFPHVGRYITLTEYAADLQAEVAYPKEQLTNVLGAVIAAYSLTQLRIAETEKYAHVTYFINGGQEAPLAHEDRTLVASPKVATYDLQPEMSVNEVTDKLITAINEARYDVIICNYANPDMVGHTGKMPAAVQAIEAVDQCLGRVITALEKQGGEAIIIADHGNAEQMVDLTTQQPHTAHTTNLVPFIYVGRAAKITREQGKLTDVAPTMLYLLALPQPAEMTGKSMVEFA